MWWHGAGQCGAEGQPQADKVQAKNTLGRAVQPSHVRFVVGVELHREVPHKVGRHLHPDHVVQRLRRDRAELVGFGWYVVVVVVVVWHTGQVRNPTQIILIILI